MWSSDSGIGAASALRLGLATMRRNIQRWQRNIGGNIGGRGASPNNSNNETRTPTDCYDTLFTFTLLWTFELYLILSYRYKDLLISWSYLLILSFDLILAILSLDPRSYLDLLIISSDDDPRYLSLYELYIITYMHLTCLWLMSFIDDRHAFYTCCCATCFYLTLDMLWTHILHVFTLRTTHGH